MQLKGDQAASRLRMPTGIITLDEMLYGGVLKGGLYLVLGETGTGKTIFVNQLAFYHAQQHEMVAYFTIFGETNARLLGHVGQFSFFRPDDVGTRIIYLNAYRDLRDGGMPGLLQIIEQYLRQHQVSLLLLDGLPMDVARATQADLFTVYDFFTQLQAVCELTSCTAFLSIPAVASIWEHHALLFVDGALEFQRTVQNMTVLRTMQIRKFRGSTYRAASHPFTITTDGITFFP